MDQKLFDSLRPGSVVRVTRSAKLYMLTRTRNGLHHFRQLRDGKLYGRDFLTLKASNVEPHQTVVASFCDRCHEVSDDLNLATEEMRHHCGGLWRPARAPAPQKPAARGAVAAGGGTPADRGAAAAAAEGLPVVGKGQPATSAFTDGELQIDGTVRAGLTAMIRPGTPERKAWPWCCTFHSGGGYPADPCSEALPIPAMRVDMTAGLTPPRGHNDAQAWPHCCLFHQEGGGFWVSCGQRRAAARSSAQVMALLQKEVVRAARSWAAEFPCPPAAAEPALFSLWAAAEAVNAHEEGRTPHIEGDQTPPES